MINQKNKYKTQNTSSSISLKASNPQLAQSPTPPCRKRLRKKKKPPHQKRRKETKKTSIKLLYLFSPVSTAPMSQLHLIILAELSLAISISFRGPRLILSLSMI